MTKEDKLLLERVRAWLKDHEQEMIDELKLWVSQPSVSRADLGKEGAPFGPDCRKMLTLALERGKHYGFDTEDYGGYVGCILSDGGPEEIGMVCHLDVVPEGDHWIYAPYEPVVKDGWMIGRGCGDNKGPGVLSLFAARCLKELKVPMKHRIRLMLGCSEETGMDDFPAYIEKLHGPVPAVSLVADASFPLCVGQKGGLDGDLRVPCGKNIAAVGGGTARNIIPDYAWAVLTGITMEQAKAALAEKENITLAEDPQGVKVEAHGKAGHAAFPPGTLNAIEVLAKAIAGSTLMDTLDLKGMGFLAAALEDAYGAGLDAALEDEISGKLTLNGGILKKDGDALSLTIDIRFPVTLDGEEIKGRVARTAENMGGALASCKVTAPYYIDPKDPKVTTLMSIYNELSGEETEPYTMGGGTYSRVVPNAMTFGPGLTKGEPLPDFMPEGHGNAHGPDEALSLSDWFKGFEIYVLSLVKLDALA